ncbi:alpha/beta hydrolase family protein [Streptomyces sp. NPDC048172]|uniref:alpha/beta hydrolase family protein n=1 Tax=Streptomyces sp. NPDC048172 TaxID=3365505 RepID=UPI003712653C
MISTRRRKTAVLVAALGPLLATVACTSASASPAGSPGSAGSAAPEEKPRLAIPELSGPYAVGRDAQQLVDRSRKDPWVPSAGPRRLMMSLYYPAREQGERQGKTAPYMSGKEAELLLKGIKKDDKIDPATVAATRTHARTGAAPARGKHPLVLLSPGFTLNRATLTHLAEDLASRGYVVASLDHAYESFGTEFPGGLVDCVACERVEQQPDDAAEKKLLAKAARGRAADMSFALDKLLGPGGKGAGRYASMIDPKRIGAAGHSLGGNASAYALGSDPRIRAAANLDGTFFAPVPRAALGRPVLMFGTEAGHRPGSKDETWPRDWSRLKGWKKWLTVKDAGHFSFNDLPVLAGQLGYTDPEAPLSGKRSGEINTGYVGAFFEQHLKGHHQKLLDGPSKANPEVTFQNP